MRKLLFFTFWLISSQSYADSVTQNYYPKEIIKLGLEKQYDYTKWFMYVTQCRLSIEFTARSGITQKGITCGMLPLEFDHLEVRGDSIEIDFYFLYKNKKVNALLAENPPIWGLVLDKKTDMIIFISSRSDIRYYEDKCFGKSNCPGFESFLKRKENIDYIKKNKNKIDPWFRKEAIKRGVIKE